MADCTCILYLKSPLGSLGVLFGILFLGFNLASGVLFILFVVYLFACRLNHPTLPVLVSCPSFQAQ